MRKVKFLKLWSMVGVAALGGVLAGCGGSGDSDSGSASLRLANATLTHPSLNLLANSNTAVTGTAADTVSAYISPSSGATTFQINDTTSGTALTTSTPTLTGSAHYTLLAYESNGAVRTVVLNENFPSPATNTAQLLIYDVALEAGRLDVYITDPAVDLSTVSAAPVTLGSDSPSSGLLTLAPGTYRVRVTGAGNKNDLRLDVPSIVLTNQQIATVALTPAAGGILLNGSTLYQQTTYSATRNTNARVRVASAVSGGATVTATAGTTPIEAGSVSPAFGFYVLVPASSALNISVNGNSVGAPAGTLTAGGDSTVLVYGNAAAPTATLLADDNRPPADSSTVKLRLINGITGTTGTLSLTANAAPVGTAVAPGAASGYVAVIGSSNPMNLSLTSSLVGGELLSNTSNTLSANTTYTVLAGGDFSAPKMLIR